MATAVLSSTPARTVLRAFGPLLCLLPGLAAAAVPPEAEDAVDLETVEVRGRAADLLGVSDSASRGVVRRSQFEYRPLARIGELLEVVPGAVATQHSGSGKANQFFLRGFNLDHGTDFNATLDGVPLNLRTHAHGQGYLDLNSIIPELVSRIDYGKGPYYADQGDFSSAGYSRFHTLPSLPKGLAQFSFGQYGYYRGLVANSHRWGDGDVLYAGEVNGYNGPWVQPEDGHKYNGMLRYTVDREDFGYALNAKAYHSSWTATNQIPKRAVQAGELSLYGTMDPSDGGDTNRHSVVGSVWSRDKSHKNDLHVYALYYDLDLYSNFSGYLADPVNGDQIQQKESRWVAGAQGEQTWFHSLFGFDMDHSVGFQVRYDGVSGLALNQTVARRLLNAVSLDDVKETSLSFYARNQTHWLSRFRTVAGLRSDTFWFDVASRITPANSGRESSTLVSPKLSLILGPWARTEVFINLGYGFHSNDARGVTARVNPLEPGVPLNPAPGLSRQRGAEGGVRTEYLSGLVSTLAVWYLRSDSELVFVGDAGTTEASGASERYGVEWTNTYQPLDWLTLDADFAFTSAYFLGVPQSGNDIPNAVGQVIGAGALAKLPAGFFATARLRNFAQVPLNESGTATLGTTTLVNLGAGWEYRRVKLAVDVFNLFDSTANDIAYYYESRFPQASEAQEGIMIHPVTPRQVRATISVSF